MVKVLGIPFNTDASFLQAAARFPAGNGLIANTGAVNAYSENGREILSGKLYETPVSIEFKNNSAADAFKIIRQAVAKELLQPVKILSYGGGHSVTYPVVDAFSEKYPGLHVLHLDAHADLYESFYDNPFSQVSPFVRLLEKKKIKSLTQVGIRTLNKHQKAQAEKYGVQIIEMKNFSFSFLETLQSPLYISLNIDVLDPAFAPGVSHPEPGGLSTRQLIHIIQNIPVEIAGADLLEFNPAKDINHMTATVCYKLFKELIDKMAG